MSEIANRDCLIRPLSNDQMYTPNQHSKLPNKYIIVYSLVKL